MGTSTLKGESLAYSVTYGGRGATLRSDRWRYTRWGEEIEAGNEELYDHMNDPEEHSNLANDREMQTTLTQMRGKFDLARKKARTTIETQ